MLNLDSGSVRSMSTAAMVAVIVAVAAVLSSPTAGQAQAGRGCSVFSPCPSGYSCHPFIQRCYNEPRREGQPCMAGYSCGRGLTCEAGSQRCRGPSREGEACHATRPCASGLTCEAGTQRCRGPGREGDPCHLTRPCGSGLTCEAGSQRCRAPGKFGESCHLTRPCGEGLYCQPFQQKCAVGELDLNSALACRNYRVSSMASAARDMGATMAFGAGSWSGAGATVTMESGTVYGQGGQYGCYATVCGGVQTDVGLGSYGAAGIFTRWEDFQGASYVITQGAQTPFAEFGFQTSQILDTQGRLIGTSSGLSFGVGLAPVQAGGAACCTVVVNDQSSLRDLNAGVQACRQQIANTGNAPPTRSGGAAPVQPTPQPRPTPQPPRPVAAGAAATSQVILRGFHGRFLVAEPDGNANANRSAAGPWETWVMTDLNGGLLTSGDVVTLRGAHGKYLVAESDGRANADRDAAAQWERWTITALNRPAGQPIQSGDPVNLRSYHGKFLVAESDGRANANRDAAAQWERWTLQINGQGAAQPQGQPQPVQPRPQPQPQPAAPASGFVRIQNRWKPNEYLHNQRGPVESGGIQPGWWSAQWTLQRVPGTQFVRLQNRWKPDQFIHNERGRVEVGPIDPGWWSAMWTLQPVPGTNFVRIQNRWKPNEFLHVERGRLESGAIDPGWWSAQWNVGGNPGGRDDAGLALAAADEPAMCVAPAVIAVAAGSADVSGGMCADGSCPPASGRGETPSMVRRIWTRLVGGGGG